MDHSLPTNQACLRNQQPILEVLSQYFTKESGVLELACGTAQHAVHMATHLPHLTWYATDTLDKLEAANLWIKSAGLPNLGPSQALDVNNLPWSNPSSKPISYGYCANLIHFVSTETAQNVFKGMKNVLSTGGLFAIYGPINEQGFTSEGNKNLDAWLKEDINPLAGIKEFNDICIWGKEQGFTLTAKEAMPANNYLLFFRKD
jgi:SAM-dependent methyltransferase